MNSLRCVQQASLRRRLFDALLPLLSLSDGEVEAEFQRVQWALRDEALAAAGGQAMLDEEEEELHAHVSGQPLAHNALSTSHTADT